MLATLEPSLLALLLHEHRTGRLPRLQRLWDYYRNPDHHGQPAQTRGLPHRLHAQTDQPSSTHSSAREIVIENDIAWRLHAQVDFMFGKRLSLRSLAPDPDLATRINALLDRVFEAAGGEVFFHDLALLGAIYGHVDVLVRLDGRDIALELVDPFTASPLTRPGDYRRLDAYIVHHALRLPAVEPTPLLHRLRPHRPAARRRRLEVTHVWTADTHAVIHGPVEKPDAVRTDANPFGRVPIVHIQNLPQPFYYEGWSDVEPLIPLQDELNTRLCDRANRVTFQSFKMYLAKGIDGFLERAVGPGQMWQTDNEQASIQEFGGDGQCPGEDAHILDIREAMDKCSGVSPVAAGIVRDRVGNLTSENALRVVLMGLIAKTQRKRVTYGQGLSQLCELILHAAQLTGQLDTGPDDRAVRLDWPNPYPGADDDAQRLRDARLKLDLGVPQSQILAELGYAECPAA